MATLSSNKNNTLDKISEISAEVWSWAADTLIRCCLHKMKILPWAQETADGIVRSDKKVILKWIQGDLTHNTTILKPLDK